MDFEELLTETWGKYLQGVGRLILFVVVGFLLCITIVLIPTVIRGFTKGFLDYARQDKLPEFELLWDFQDFWQMVLLVIITGVALFIGYSLLIIPGVILNIFLLYCTFYLVDRNTGAVESIKASIDTVLRTGFENNLLVFLIVAVLNGIGGLVPFGVFITMPFTTLFVAIVFRGIVQGETLAPSDQS